MGKKCRLFFFYDNKLDIRTWVEQKVEIECSSYIGNVNKKII